MRLVYVSDRDPGYRRQRRGARFVYLDASGRALRDARALQRIRALAIPPAYTDVWICRNANGHLQATGRDARGRKQYRYHEQWRARRDADKYDRVVTFSEQLPLLRRRVAADLGKPGLPREKVLAAVVRLLEASLIRVGNEEYARANGSFGLTTLQNDHVQVRGEQVEFRFRGKSGKFHKIRLEDARMARLVRRCQDLPGQTLFQYRDAGSGAQNVRSDDVNAYIRAIAGSEFSAKDFRTWAGTVLTAMLLGARPTPDGAGAAKMQVAAAIREVAQRLGNTPKVCQACYVHPRVIDAYLAGRLRMPKGAQRRAEHRLSAAERAVQRLLRGGGVRPSARPALELGCVVARQARRRRHRPRYLRLGRAAPQVRRRQVQRDDEQRPGDDERAHDVQHQAPGAGTRPDFPGAGDDCRRADDQLHVQHDLASQ